MSIFRRIMLGGGVDIDALPNTQKIYYKATAKIVPEIGSLGSPIIVNKWNAATSEGIIVCSRDITIINRNVFSGISSLTSITIPNSVTTIKGEAFKGCSSLTSVTIPDSVTEIWGGVFDSCSSLTSITIPDSVTSIGDRIFNGCSSMTAFYGKFASTDNRCLIKDGEVKSFAPAGLTKYTIPNSITSIGNYVFSGCDSLTNIIIPDSVNTIGQYAFNQCASLTSVTIGNGVTNISHNAFRNCTSMQYYDFSTHGSVPTLVDNSAFYSIPFTCKIIVPDALYEEWIVATNWIRYASRIIKKSDWDAQQVTE